MSDDRPTVIRKTREELEAQREKLLSESRLSHDELRDRAEDYTLSMDERMTLNTIEGIDYLLHGR